MDKHNKEKLIAVLSVIAICGFVFFIMIVASHFKTKSLRSNLESELKVLIADYVRVPKIDRLKALDSVLNDMLNRAEDYGFKDSEVSDLKGVSFGISSRLKVLCADKDCKYLEDKESKYSNFVNDYKDSLESYERDLKRAKEDKISRVHFVCPAIAKETDNLYVFFCFANSSERVYLAMYKSDYQPMNLSGYGLLINTVLSVKDAGIESTRIDGVNTLIQTYALADMPSKPQIISKYSLDDFERTKRALDNVQNDLNDIRRERFVGVHNGAISHIEKLADFIGYKLGAPIKPLKENISLVDSVLRKVYGEYTRSNKCWKYFSKLNNSNYCIELINERKVSIDGKDYIAFAVKGSVIPHVEVGSRYLKPDLVGLFVVDMIEPFKFLAKREEIFIGNFANQKIDSVDLEKAGENLYSWVVSWSFKNNGHYKIRTIVASPYNGGYESLLGFESFSNSDLLSQSAAVTCFDCFGKERIYTSSISFDADSGLLFYPINFKVDGKFGERDISTNVKLKFDEKSGKYLPEKPLSNEAKTIFFNIN